MHPHTSSHSTSHTLTPSHTLTLPHTPLHTPSHFTSHTLTYPHTPLHTPSHFTSHTLTLPHTPLHTPSHFTSTPSHTLTLPHTPLHTPLQHSLPRTPITDSNDDGNLLTGLTEEESSFCSRFQLSPDELPLPSWTLGRRCTLLDKDHPLIGTKSGKLFITHRWDWTIMVGLNDNGGVGR